MNFTKKVLFILPVLFLVICLQAKAEGDSSCATRAVGESCRKDEIDSDTFKDLGDSYSKDKNHVYILDSYVDRYTNEAMTPANYIIISNSPDSFLKIPGNAFYAKDKTTVFYYGVSIDGADIKTFKVLGGGFSKDKNYVYHSQYFCWRESCYGATVKLIGIDSASVKVLKIGKNYLKDKKGYYFVINWVPTSIELKVNRMKNVNAGTFAVLDDGFAMDKNNMYQEGKILSKNGTRINNNALYQKFKGRVIRKNGDENEIYYISPVKKEIYDISSPMLTFKIMRNLGLSITNKKLEKISAANCPAGLSECDKPAAYDLKYAEQQKGKIFFQTQAHGEAWYVFPDDNKRYYLGRPADAYNLMKLLSVIISDDDFNSLTK